MSANAVKKITSVENAKEIATATRIAKVRINIYAIVLKFNYLH